LLSLLATAAYGEDATTFSSLAAPYLAAFTRLEQHEIAALALILGVVFFAVFTAILLVRTHARGTISEAAARDRIAALKSEVDRLTGLVLSEPNVLVSWPAARDEPDIIGDPTIVAPDADRNRVLAFGAWLDVDQARAMDHAIERLRAEGESFSRSLTTASATSVSRWRSSWPRSATRPRRRPSASSWITSRSRPSSIRERRWPTAS